MAKLFSTFDLSSVQISFVGLIGDFAVWAITDLTTGDIEYVIDDSGGSTDINFKRPLNKLGTEPNIGK